MFNTNNGVNGLALNNINWRHPALISTLGTLLLGAIYLIVSLVDHEYVSIWLVGCLMLIQLISLLIGYTRKTEPARSVKILGYIVSSLIFFAALIFSPRSSIYLMLSLLYPPLIIANAGLKTGNWCAIIFGALMSLLLFLPHPGNHAAQIDLFEKLVIVPSYFGLHMSLMVMMTIMARRTHKLRESIEHKTNDKLAHDEALKKVLHQIRTPLNNITIVTNMMAKSDLDEQYADMVDTLQASINTLTSALNSMGTFSPVDPTIESNPYTTFNLSKAINNTIKMFATQSTNVSFNYQINSQLPQTFVGDPIKLKQVFLNVIECFIKNKVGSTLNIAIRVNPGEHADALRFEFYSNRPIFVLVNDGEMVKPSADQNVMTEQLDLNISRQIVQHNGGQFHIDIGSDDATINFSYNIRSNAPQASSQVADNEPINAQTVAPASSPANTTFSKSEALAKANVLLVEDNLINQKILILCLKKVVQNIEVANNGKEALDKFGTSKYDIILMDVQMPIMNGYVTSQKIREIETSINVHTPIIAITANALRGDRDQCIAAGMDDYISKPFQIEVLIQKMETLLGNK